jgi:hypothetical protein
VTRAVDRDLHFCTRMARQLSATSSPDTAQATATTAAPTPGKTTLTQQLPASPADGATSAGKRATTIQNIVLHQAPGKDTPRVAAQPDWVGPGTSFDIVGASGSWLQVPYKGLAAFITAGSKYVKIEDAPATQDPATQTPGAQPPAGTAPAGGGIVDTLTGAVTSGLDAIGDAIAGVPGAISSGANRLIDLIAGITEPSPSEQPQLDRDAENPANQTPAPGETPAPGQSQTGPAFADQRDNTFVGSAGGKAVTGENECNITTLAMQIRTVAQDDAKVRAACCANLERLGGKVTDDDRASAQIEDLLLRRFFLPAWAGGDEWRKLESQKPFWIGFADAVSGRKYHQNSLCINHVAGELTSALPIGALGHDEAKNDADQARLLTQDYYKTTFVPVLAGGGSVLLSTELTGGHIVLLNEVLEDGVTINDPYGMCLEKVENARGYLRHGDALSWGLKVKETYAANVATRSKMNTGPIASVVKGGAEKMPGNLGERNFYTWAEVKTYLIGKWNNTMEKKK